MNSSSSFFINVITATAICCFVVLATDFRSTTSSPVMVDAFHPSQWRRNHSGKKTTRNNNNNNNINNRPTSQWYQTDDAVNDNAGRAPAATVAETTTPSTFQRRMLDQMRQQQQQQSGMKRPRRSKAPKRSSRFNQDIHSLDDFSNFLQETASVSPSSNMNNMVLVWYHAPWCTSCHALRPGMEALARRHTTLSASSSSVKFVQIACDETNVALHKGCLNIPSVPYVQLYNVVVGDTKDDRSDMDLATQTNNNEMQLVLEMKMNRKKLNILHKTLQDYEQGSCSLERLGQWSVSCPYSFSYYDPAVSSTAEIGHGDSKEDEEKRRLRP